LADFAKHFGLGKDKGVILVCDRLSWTYGKKELKK
jgi:hypothetical protein